MKKLISVLLALLVLAACAVPAFAEDAECEHEWVWVVDQAQNEGTVILGTGNHNWVWIVDEPAGAIAPGRMHQVCTDCHAVQNMNTQIPANMNNRSFDNLLLEAFDRFVATLKSLIAQIQAVFEGAN